MLVGSIAPWWGSSVIALGGSAVTLLITTLVALLNRRTETRRLYRQERLSAYPKLSKAGRRLLTIKVWPSDPETLEAEWDNVLEIAEEIAYLGSTRVNAAAEALLTKADTHRTLITEIRRDSSPAHRGGIERRFHSRYSHSVTELRGAINDFTRAGRLELEIRGEYRPAESRAEQTDDDTP